MPTPEYFAPLPSAAPAVARSPSSRSDSTSAGPTPHPPLPAHLRKAHGFSAGGSAAPPPPRVPDVEKEAMLRFATWEPAGVVKDVCCDMTSPDAIITMGIAQNIHFLQMSWGRFKDAQLLLDNGSGGGSGSGSGSDNGGGSGCGCDADVIDAFAQAIALIVRRCPGAVQPMVAELIERAPAATLRPETLVRLAHIVADLGARSEAHAVLAKSELVVQAGGSLSAPFYLALLRLATETMTPPDMSLALDVNERMVAAGIEQTAMSIRMLFAGMARMVEPPVAAAVRLYQFRRRGIATSGVAPVEGCVTGCFFNVLDAAVGAEASLAADLVRSLPPDAVNEHIQSVCVEAPCMNREGCFTAACTRYLIVDPATVDLSDLSAVPPQTYLLFLFSTLRSMAARRHNVCAANPFTRKLDDVRRLLDACKQAVVLPYAEELSVRAALPDDTDRPSSNQERIMAFVRVMQTAKCNIFTVCVLSGDPAIVRACGERGVPCFRTLASVGQAPTVTAIGTPAAGGCPNAGDRTAACAAMRSTFCGGAPC